MGGRQSTGVLDTVVGQAGREGRSRRVRGLRQGSTETATAGQEDDDTQRERAQSGGYSLRELALLTLTHGVATTAQHRSVADIPCSRLVGPSDGRRGGRGSVDGSHPPSGRLPQWSPSSMPETHATDQDARDSERGVASEDVPRKRPPDSERRDRTQRDHAGQRKHHSHDGVEVDRGNTTHIDTHTASWEITRGPVPVPGRSERFVSTSGRPPLAEAERRRVKRRPNCYTVERTPLVETQWQTLLSSGSR